MKLTPKELRVREDAIYDALERAPGDSTFRNYLYRDGVPTPETYLSERIKVLFVFREPNMRGAPYRHDMRDEVSDRRFRPYGPDGERQERSPQGWWNGKAGMFAHAVAASLEDEPWPQAFARFARGGWNHEVVNRHAYIRSRKSAGAERRILMRFVHTLPGMQQL